MTIKYKIKHLKIPAMIVDSETKPLIITKNIIKYIEAKINKSETHNLNGIITIPIESVEVIHNLPITLASDYIIVEKYLCRSGNIM